ncbi:phosphatase, partial [Streptomyces sp. NPDC059233]
MRKLLPLLGNPHGGGRSALTCRYRCGDACFHEVPNTSDNEYVGDVIAKAYSRRSMLRTAAVVTVATAGGTAIALTGPGQSANATPTGEAGAAGAAGTGAGEAARGLRFTPVAPNTADQVT